jgi:Flp pilus assembly protein TadG
MFRENESLLLSSRAKRGTSVLLIGRNLERFAFGWRSAFNAAIYALQSAKASATEEIKAHLLRETDAAALIEFAVALPLLVVLVVGIFDFGGAFNLKQELNNAAREGARFGASQPSNDLLLGNPPSVDAVRYVVDAYLLKAKINDCGLNSAAQAPGAPLTWLYTTTGTCAGALVLTISRGVSVQTTVSGATVIMPCTTVQVSYPYQWHFNNVIQLIAPGASYAGVSQIPSDATAINMD